MPISVQNIFKERKFPFLFAFSFLLISVTILLFSYSSSSLSLLLSTNFQVSDPLPPLPPPPPLPIRSPNNVPVSSTKPVSKTTAAASDVDLNVSLDIKWENCQLGPLAVDYIPCLDNWQAIKELKSRRRMEHRERHCPKPSPRCLAPLPIGYKVPVHWPKSRDMVSFSFFIFGKIFV